MDAKTKAFIESKTYYEKTSKGVVPVTYKDIKGFVFVDNVFKYTVITSLSAMINWSKNFKPYENFLDIPGHQKFTFKDVNLVYREDVDDYKNLKPSYSLEMLTYDLGLYDKIISSSIFYEPKVMQ